MSASTDTLEIHSEPVFTATAEGRLLRQRCTACGHIPSFPRIACPACFAELEWFEPSGAGTIRTYSILRRTHAEQYAAHLPIVLAVVELEDGGEMISTIVGPGREGAEIDAAVEFAGKDGWSTLPQFRLAATTVE